MLSRLDIKADCARCSGLALLTLAAAHAVVWEIVVLLQYNRCLSELARRKQKQHCVRGKSTQFLVNAIGLSMELTSQHRVSSLKILFFF